MVPSIYLSTSYFLWSSISVQEEANLSLVAKRIKCFPIFYIITTHLMITGTRRLFMSYHGNCSRLLFAWDTVHFLVLDVFSWSSIRPLKVSIKLYLIMLMVLPIIATLCISCQVTPLSGKWQKLSSSCSPSQILITTFSLNIPDQPLTHILQVLQCLDLTILCQMQLKISIWISLSNLSFNMFKPYNI